MAKPKKIFALSAVLLICLSLSGCAAGTEEEKVDKSRFSHPDNYLSDYIASLKFGDIEFTLDYTPEEFQKAFGDDLTVWYSPEISKKISEDNGESENTAAINPYGDISADIVMNDRYIGYLRFRYDTVLEKYYLFIVSPGNDPRSIDKAAKTKAHCIENGEILLKEFENQYNTFSMTINEFTTGSTERSEMIEYFGESVRHNEYEGGVIMDAYEFKDYGLVLYYLDGVFARFLIFDSDYKYER